MIDDWQTEQAITQALTQSRRKQEISHRQARYLYLPDFHGLALALIVILPDLLPIPASRGDMGRMRWPTGEGTILVRTDGIIAASDDEVNEQINQLRGDFDSLIHNDINSAIGIRLADIRLDVNPDMVRQLLLGQTGQ